jgi:uncharacterized protein (TIGR02246 family)
MAVADEVEDIEHRGWQALSSADGAAFYANLMADDGLMVFPGSVLDRQQSLRAIAGAPPWASFDLEDVRVIETGPDGALVTYRAIAQREGEAPYRAWMSSVYARRDGAWRLVLHQQSPDPPTG